MDSFLKLLEASKAITFEQLIKVGALMLLLLWASTEGREVWLDDAEAAKTDMNTELLVHSISQTATREDKQDDIIQQLNISQQLLQQQLNMEIQRLNREIGDN